MSIDKKTTERINTAMKHRCMTQAELARRTNLSRPTINQYVKGVAIPKQDRIFILAKALNVSPTWLMGVNDNMNIIKSVNNSLVESDMQTEHVTITYTIGTPVREALVELSKLNETGMLKLIDYMNFLLTQEENIKFIEEVQNIDDM